MGFADMDKSKDKHNKKINAGTAVTLVAAAGVIAATPQGRKAAKKIFGSGSQQDSQPTTTGLAAWLKDAYAMEEAQLKTLKGIAADFKDHEEIYETLCLHL